MDKRIVELWADIGSEDYWDDFMKRNGRDFVLFEERWPQPGFIGRYYFDMPKRVLVAADGMCATSSNETTKTLQM